MGERKKGDFLTAEEQQAAVDMANKLTVFSAEYDVGVTFLAMALIIANNADDEAELYDMCDFITGLALDLLPDVKAGQQ